MIKIEEIKEKIDKYEFFSKKIGGNFGLKFGGFFLISAGGLFLTPLGIFNTNLEMFVLVMFWLIMGLMYLLIPIEKIQNILFFHHKKFRQELQLIKKELISLDVQQSVLIEVNNFVHEFNDDIFSLQIRELKDTLFEYILLEKAEYFAEIIINSYSNLFYQMEEIKNINNKLHNNDLYKIYKEIFDKN